MTQIFNREYSGESIVDIEQDIYDAINNTELPVDEHGFIAGTFRVTIQFKEYQEDQ
jgi:hypothetical protein